MALLRFSTAPFLVLLGAGFFTSCGPLPTGSTMNFQREKVLYEWLDDGGTGEVSIRISLSDQIAEFRRGQRFIGWCYVATGKEGHSTKDGSYRITEMVVDKYSNRYGWIEDEFGNVVDNDASPGDRVDPGMIYVPAPMPYWMRLTSYGIGMHGGLIPEPGKPASHGCIRMPKNFVPLAYEAVKLGTPVTITHTPSVEGKQRALVLNGGSVQGEYTEPQFQMVSRKVEPIQPWNERMESPEEKPKPPKPPSEVPSSPVRPASSMLSAPLSRTID